MLAGLEKIRGDGWQLQLTAAQQKVVDDLLLESESHTVFVRESLVRENDAQLTVTECYAGYVEFCNERGWRALTRNKLARLSVTPSCINSVSRRGMIFQRATANRSAAGKGFAYSENFVKTSEKKPSETSERTLRTRFSI